MIRRKLEGHDAVWSFIEAPSDRLARRLSTRALHDACAHVGAIHLNGDTYIKMAEAELRRREAWELPAGRAIYVSAGAALLSAFMSGVALLVTLLSSIGK